MSLLQEIITGASRDSVSTPVLLRMVKVLAARTGIHELGEWVGSELNGYADQADIPSYRGPFHGEARGTFLGPFGSQMTGALIPALSFPKGFRDGPLFSYDIRQSVSELNDLADKAEGDRLVLPWGADTVAMVNSMINDGRVRLYPGMGLFEANISISASQIRSILDQVRNRILDLALSIEAEDPNAGEAGGTLMAEERGNNIFNTVVHGGNVAMGSSHFVQQVLSNPAKDDDSLADQLQQLGVPADLIEDLRAALNEDRAASSGELTSPGTQVQGWIGRISTLAASTGGKIGTSVTSAVVTQAVLAYFGLGT